MIWESNSLLKLKTTKKGYGWGKQRKKVSKIAILIVDAKKVEMEEGNRRRRKKIQLKMNIQRQVLCLTHYDYKKQKGEKVELNRNKKEKTEISKTNIQKKLSNNNKNVFSSLLSKAAVQLFCLKSKPVNPVKASWFGGLSQQEGGHSKPQAGPQ